MGRQDYDGGYSSSGTGAAATSSSFSGGYSDPYESPGTVGTVNYGSGGGNRFDSSDDPFYRSQINRGVNTNTPRETPAQREERLRKEGIDKARAEVEGRMKDFTGLKIGNLEVPTALTGMLNALTNIGRQSLLNALDKKGAKAIYDKGSFIGVVSKNALGLDVYTGRKVAGYTGEFSNLIADTQSDEGDSDVRVVRDYGGGDLGADRDDEGFTRLKPDLPEKDDEVGDGEEGAQAKREYGPQTQIGTSAQGLLTTARTRRRSLLAGGLIR